MARFCFYCGRELASGEKCNCRTHPAGTSGKASTGQSSQAGQSGQSSQTGQASQAGQSSQAKKAKKAPFGAGFNFNSARTSTAQPHFGSQAKSTKNSSRKGLDKTAILAGFQQFARYLAQPVETIRQSVQFADPRRLLTLLLLHAALGGVAALILSQLGTLDLLLQLTVAGSADSPALGAIFLAVQGFGLTLILDLLLIVITLLALKYVFRTNFTLVRVASSLNPVIFYNIIFLILALFSLTAVPISSLLMLSAGLAVSAVALYLALRQLTNFDENRCFILVVFILVIFISVISMLLTLATPVLTVLLDQTMPL